ncbi:uncharacterized protein LOC127802218 [Diospyros lotus]|uniref:uncharacterized protein LOC127802218 n=1 Tax=Diospyros lotus TaxID=55363 RepID=UPI0022517D5A|nr:uncharacterized protein LOC127802218 [Diospyros lotus]
MDDYIKKLMRWEAFYGEDYGEDDEQQVVHNEQHVNYNEPQTVNQQQGFDDQNIENFQNENAVSFDASQTFVSNEIFSNRETLIEWVKTVGKENDMVIVIKSSESGGIGRKPRVRLACEWSGKYKSSKKGDETIGETNRRTTGSKKCGYPFELLGVKLSNEHWMLKVVCGLHNHLPAAQLEGHSYAGRLTEKEKQILITMSNNLVKSRNILMTLKAEDEKNDEYEHRLYELTLEYHAYEGALNYVRKTWLNDYKEKFVAAWTNRIMHFGNVTMNRAESAHAKLKRHLGSSQGDLESSWTIINSPIELQHVEIKGSFEKSLTLVQHNFKPVIFRELGGVISKSALNMVLMQSQLAHKIGIDKVSCGCVIRTTYGLPCACEIAEFMVQGRPIPLSTVHIH